MLIQLSIEKTEPLTGTAATRGEAPLHFDGWLELLNVLSELTATRTEETDDGGS